jgi:hypothetical protein
MAQGDVKQDLQVIANGGILTIRPPAGEEWTIHNVYYTQPVIVRVFKATGSVTLTFDSDTSQGAMTNRYYHVTNEQYLQVLNNYAGNNTIGFDGVQTK